MSSTEVNYHEQAVKELTQAVSIQAQVANRVWLGLMAVALVVVARTASGGKTTLPFVGDVDVALFHTLLFWMLIVLTIAFSSAYSAQFRAHKLAQSFITSNLKSHKGRGGVHPRDLFDMLRFPTFNRVAPLAQRILGKAQFYTGAEKTPKWRTVAATIYYLLLKLVSLAVYFGLPAFALFDSWREMSLQSHWWWLATVAGGLAMVTVLEVCFDDLLLTLTRATPQIWRGHLED